MAASASLKQRAWSPAHQVYMAASAAASPWAAIEGAGDNLGRAHLWEMELGTQRALVAVRGIPFEHGRLLEIAGLRSLGDRITPEGVQLLDTLAREVYQADLLSMTTLREHLVPVCIRAGWSTKVAATLTKNLRAH
jgi:hypothetical protein